jgi:hypothetical protein
MPVDNDWERGIVMESTMRNGWNRLAAGLLTGSSLLIGEAALASSHMDAPLITLDDPANTTDVYAFVSEDSQGARYLTTALAVYPFEEPGIGPNTYRFDDDVRYNIHVALDDDVPRGRESLTYSFRFQTTFANRDTVLKAFLGPIESGPDCSLPAEQAFDPNQNLRQTYVVTLTERGRKPVALGSGVVPPNNQGLLTRYYNQRDSGERPARGGVVAESDLDRYTQGAICDLEAGHRTFAGQRDDGFYADIQSIFDLDFTFGGPNKPFDSQGGFNVHTIVLEIPLEELGGATVAGVYATTERRRTTALSTRPEQRGDRTDGPFVQVARQGNPLFNEALVAVGDADLYNRVEPREDDRLFADYALNPELATALGLPDQDRQDLAAIFIPDVIKVDLTTPPARLAGERGFNRLSVFGGDTLTNAAGAQVAGGWPNGRRFGDDVVDIAVLALGLGATNVDRVTANDITYNRVFPYAATPLNGRNHGHH